MKSVLAFAADMQLVRRTCTMKGIWGSSVAALLAMTSSGAFAADLPIRKAPPPLVIPVYNWTGFYIGGNVGGAWEHSTLTDNDFGVSFSNNRSGFIGGGQIGYNWQVSPQFVLGVEWMFDGTDIKSDTTVDLFRGTEKVNWLTTVTGRLGYAVNNWLFYGKGGGGWVHDTATVTDLVGGGSVSISDTKGGWVAGAGVEYGFTPNWTGKVEYQHLGLEDVSNAGLTLSRHFDMVTVGLNYKF